MLSEHLPAPPPFEYVKKFIGYHLDDCFLDVLPHYDRAQLDAMIRSYRTIYLERKHSATTRYPHVPETLRDLPGRKGTGTTKGTPTTRAILEQFELLPYFDHVQGTDGFPCKPAPDVLLHAMTAMSVKPEDCLFVGDSVADVEAGRAAGVKVCGVRYGYGDQALMQPDYWIDDIRELL